MPKRTKKPKSKLLRKEARAAYLYLIPAFIGLIVLTYIPLIAVFGLSFFKWGGTGAPEWNGINNYIKLFTTDPYFKESIKVTVYFSLLAVVGSMVYSLIVAMLLNRKIPARGFFRAVFYLPYVLPAAAVYIGWSWLYNTEWGLFNYILSKLGIERLMFVSSSSQVVPSLALIAVWLSGNLIVIFLAGLQNVPRVYHEAAEIDGPVCRCRRSCWAAGRRAACAAERRACPPLRPSPPLAAPLCRSARSPSPGSAACWRRRRSCCVPLTACSCSVRRKRRTF